MDSRLALRPPSDVHRASCTGLGTRGQHRAGCLAGRHPRHAVPGPRREEGGCLLGRLRARAPGPRVVWGDLQQGGPTESRCPSPARRIWISHLH